MADNLQLAKALRQAEMRPTPRSGMTGMLADALMGARNFADRAKVPDFVPLIGGEGVGSLLVGKAPEEVNEWSYGNSPIQMNPYAGRTASFVPEMKRGRGQQLADALSLLSLPGGKTAASMMMGAVPGVDTAMFIGSKAKTWDAAAAARAVEMEKAGVPAQSIWSETGTLRGPDGLLRQEIDDSQSAFSGLPMKPAPVSASLQHDPLSVAYPNEMQIPAMYSSTLGPGVKAQYGTFHGETGILGAADADKSTMLHELQHAIQQREGFARGGNPEMFNQQKDAELARDALDWARELRRIRSTQPGMDSIAAENKAIQDYQQMGALEFVPSREARDLARQPGVLFDSPNAYQSASDLEALSKMYGLDQRTTPYTAQEAYRRLAGEAEARATQARMNMTPAERRATFPYESYDVPLNQLIVR